VHPNKATKAADLLICVHNAEVTFPIKHRLSKSLSQNECSKNVPDVPRNVRIPKVYQ
jgi:hypothetical protein